MPSLPKVQIAIINKVRDGTLIIECANDIASIITSSDKVIEFWTDNTISAPVLNSKIRKSPDELDNNVNPSTNYIPKLPIKAKTKQRKINPPSQMQSNPI